MDAVMGAVALAGPRTARHTCPLGCWLHFAFIRSPLVRPRGRLPWLIFCHVAFNKTNRRWLMLHEGCARWGVPKTTSILLEHTLDSHELDKDVMRVSVTGSVNEWRTFTIMLSIQGFFLGFAVEI
jgi:hypothetical protein